MKKLFNKEKNKIVPWAAVAIVFIAVISVIVAVILQGKSNQADDAIVPDVIFCGEYRISNGEWQPLSNAGHISATDGNVELKGVFRLYYSETGEDLGAVESGTVISLYLDHIKATIKDSKGNVWISDNENDLIGKGACTESWSEYLFEGEAGDEVNVIIYNPHVFGNEKAVDRLLDSLGIYIATSDGGLLSSVGGADLAIGIFLVVFLFILFGVALLLSVLRNKYSKEIWLFWLAVFFGGIYFLFSRDNISVWNPYYTVNTIIIGSSMMLYLLTVYALIGSSIRGRFKKSAIFVTALLGAATVISIFSSLHSTVKFYNTYPYWILIAVCAAIVLIACAISDMVGCKKREESTRIYVHVTAIAVLTVFIIDVIATLMGVWQGGELSVMALLMIVIIAIVIIGRVVPKSIKTVLEAKSIEAERQAMERKLQESHISIMLSQIQPHFLYNTLNSIYYLCETNPMRAKFMVNSFSEYLRNNLSSIEETGLISFETELSHINTYLDIEKVRFEDTLEIEYDIKCNDFSLPVLTVQPIVENAVKHGTSKKRGGGKVIISTLEDKENYIIKVSDTGCGFDPEKPKNDGKRHVGIENVRQRLSNMCGGSLSIESEVGVGTVATITIPKGGKK